MNRRVSRWSLGMFLGLGLIWTQGSGVFAGVQDDDQEFPAEEESSDDAGAIETEDVSGSDLEGEASTPDESESTGDEEVADGAPEDVAGDLVDEPAGDAVDSEEPAEGPGDDTAEASADEGIESAEVDAAGDEADDALEEVEAALGDDATDGNAGAPAAESPSNPAPTPRAPASSPAPNTAPAPAPVATPSAPAAPPARPTTEGSVQIVIFGFDGPKASLSGEHLDAGHTDVDVETLVGQFVVDEPKCHLRVDDFTGKSKGSAICTMASRSDADEVFRALNGQEWDGKTMRVMRMNPN